MIDLLLAVVAMVAVAAFAVPLVRAELKANREEDMKGVSDIDAELVEEMLVSLRHA